MTKFADTTQQPFVNEKGVKFWLHPMLTEYAQKPDIKGITLPNVQVFLIEETNGLRTHVLVENGEIEYENTSLETMAVHIDMMKVCENHE